MKLSKHVLYSAGAFVAIAAIGALTSPKLAAAVRATFVEMVIPSQTFHKHLSLPVPANPCCTTPAEQQLFGPDTGKLGVTNITVANYGSTPALVHISVPLVSVPGCVDYPTGAGEAVRMAELVVPGSSTVVVPYPSPLTVDSSVNGHTCLVAYSVGNNNWVALDVSGFVN